MASVTCPQCGTVNPANSKFCDGCGINLTQRLHASRALNATPATPLASAPLTGQPSHAPLPPVPAGPTPGPAAAAPPAGALQLGRAITPGLTIGVPPRYRIVAPLGKGGMGSIFLAHDTRVNNKPVVIKQMLPNFTTEEERVEAEASFNAEMETLAAMSHPNIPQITDYFSEAGFNFIVQEFVPGEDLQKKADAAGGKGLPERQVLGWASQVLAVLDYLEKLDPQIIHRDIKPANVVVEDSGRVRVVDFGVASHKFRVGTPQSGINKASTAMGTPGYAPKEQFLGQETPLSDQYALGATMHQLLTGRNPQGVEPLFAYPPIRSIRPTVSEAAARVVTRALHNDPALRYPHAAAMKAEVDAILNPKGTLSTARGKALALAVVLLVLIGVAGGVAVYEKQQAELPATGSISQGRVAFDRDISGRGESASDPAAWAQAKADASREWKNNNLSRAQEQYQAAISNDQTDAESHIYAENANILSAGQPYYVIGIGGSFSGPKITSGRFALQGAFTAQHELNLNGGIAGRKIVLTLANDASSASGAAEAAQAAGKDQHLLGFIGYSSSSRTQNAMAYLAGAGIPHIAATASNPGLNGSTYFFRICPSDVVQGQQLASYARTLLAGRAQATVLVFKDPNDKYSGGLATIFSSDLPPSIRTIERLYTAQSGSAKGTQKSEYQATLQGLNQKPDLIFFAGYASDALRLGAAMDALGDRTTRVLSDDAFYDAQEFINAGQVFKGRYYFTGYFFPDEDGLLPRDGAGARAIRAMKAEYAANFHAPGKPLGYGFARVPSEAALYYDAVKVMAAAIDRAARSTGSVGRAGLRDALAAIDVQGVSGRIRFNQTPPAPDDQNPLGIGDPIRKALVVLRLDDLGHTHMARIVGTFE